MADTKTVMMTGLTKHEGEQYEDGEQYDLPVGLADLFLTVGWAKNPGEATPPPASGTVEVQPDDVVQDQSGKQV